MSSQLKTTKRGFILDPQCWLIEIFCKACSLKLYDIMDRNIWLWPIYKQWKLVFQPSIFTLDLGRVQYIMKSVLKLGFVYTFHPMRSFLLSIVHMNQHWDAPQQQPPPGDPCGTIFPTVTELGAVSRPKICGRESHHQILLPNHKASLGEFLQINSLSDSFQEGPWKKVKQLTLEIVFVHFFKGDEQTPYP